MKRARGTKRRRERRPFQIAFLSRLYLPTPFAVRVIYTRALLDRSFVPPPWRKRRPPESRREIERAYYGWFDGFYGSSAAGSFNWSYLSKSILPSAVARAARPFFVPGAIREVGAAAGIIKKFIGRIESEEFELVAVVWQMGGGETLENGWRARRFSSPFTFNRFWKELNPEDRKSYYILKYAGWWTFGNWIWILLKVKGTLFSVSFYEFFGVLQK